jgi:glycosyltransferase involved in cell wall biosynthesis
MYLTIAIDASRNRSGGAKAHLVGILAECHPSKYNIKEVHLWSYRSLLESIPDRPWLIKHNPPELEQSLPKQLWWQANQLAKAVKAVNADILFTTDASTLCQFKPMVVFSQDLLSYEPGVMRYFGYGYARLRLIAILWIQNAAFRRASGVIFLNHYTANLIQQSCGPLIRVAYIPHGVGENFKQTQPTQPWPGPNDHRPLRCLYISNAAMYKHQWVVVQAIDQLRQRGYDLTLTLVGGGSGQAQTLLERQIVLSDPQGEFIRQVEYVPQSQLPEYLARADLFIFASSCEAWGITLVEAMAVGLPIACSQRSSLPEVLEKGGIYFNPEDANSIAEAVATIIQNPQLRQEIAAQAKARADQFSWSRCADETWSFIVETFFHSTKNMSTSNNPNHD